MRLDRIYDRLTSGKDEVRVVGRDLGDELPRQRMRFLTSVFHEMCRVPEAKDEWIEGYKTALRDVMMAFSASACERFERGDER